MQDKLAMPSLNVVDRHEALGKDPQARREPFLWPKLIGKNSDGIAYGGDYNPEQWAEDIWDEDISLMLKAKVNIVSLGIFAWGKIQPSPLTWDFEWLDRVIDKLAAADISIDLASATAAAPMWLYALHPEILPRGPKGEVINPGSRQSWRPTSPVFKKYALEVCHKLAQRYGGNPAVVAWHLDNEYGWNNRFDYSDDSLRAFRTWCERKYGTVDALNHAWGTDFWSQQVHSFDEVLVPRHVGGNDAFVNPSQQLDFQRFSSDALKQFCIAERDEIKRYCPDKPITTNFMISTDQCAMDYADWSDELNFVSNDHYFVAGEKHLDELTCSDSFVSSVALGEPWMLMENSTSAVNWKPVNSRKKNGELVRDALAHVAMGADGICFFQWRQSRSGAEAFHSSMLPHAGEKSKVFKQVCELGEILEKLSNMGLTHSKVKKARTALIFDADSEWILENKTLPTTKVDHWHDVLAWYRALLDTGERCDVVPMRGAWEDYATVILPSVFLLSEENSVRIRHYVRDGGRVVVNYASAITDDSYHVGSGGYPALLREVLGIRSEEFNILGDVPGEPDSVELSSGAVSKLWQNDVSVTGNEVTVLDRYVGKNARNWELEGTPAITKNVFGKGEAFYMGCDIRHGDLVRFIEENLNGESPAESKLSSGIFCASRQSPKLEYDFYFNRSNEPVALDAQRVKTPLFLFRASKNSDSYLLEKNGVVISCNTK
jgi:beta-galactosidase